MSNYIVSARKYRPKRFDEVVGQQNVTNTLKNAIKNQQVAHSFLFCGPRGVGKTTCARILAKTINCENLGDDFEACEQCSSCKAFQEDGSLNIFEMDAASNSNVDNIRSLTDQVRYAPQTGTYKIYIIDEVHMLSTSAFNAFLKTLEEPPHHAIFILATTEKHKLLPTILSRCQIFDFNRIRIEDIVDFMMEIADKEGIEADRNGLHIIAQKADGALRDALSMFDRLLTFSGNSLSLQDVLDNLNILDYDYYFKVTDALLAGDVATVLLTFDDILRKGFEGDLFINGLAEHFRDLLVCKDPNTVSLLEVTGDLKTRYQEQAALAPASFLLNALNLASQCDMNYKTSKNKRLHVELALIKMAHISQAVDVASSQDGQQSGNNAQSEEAASSQTAAKKKSVSDAEDSQTTFSTDTEAEQSSVEESLEVTGTSYQNEESTAVDHQADDQETSFATEQVSNEGVFDDQNDAQTINKEHQDSNLTSADALFQDEPQESKTVAPSSASPEETPPPVQNGEENVTPQQEISTEDQEADNGSNGETEKEWQEANVFLDGADIHEEVGTASFDGAPSEKQSAGEGSMETMTEEEPEQGKTESSSLTVTGESQGNAPKESMNGSFTLSDLQNNHIVNEDNKDTEVAEPEVDEENVSIDRDHLLEVWHQYMQELYDNKRLSLYGFMKDITPQVNGPTVEITLTNKLQEEIFSNERQKLNDYLKQQMGISYLRLVMKVEKNKEDQPSNRPFTAKEKMQKMAEKNDKLLKLKEELDLDLEY